MTLAALASALVAVVFLVALAYFASRIAATLEAIGDREPSGGERIGSMPSFLARIAFGVSAIEKQVSHLLPEAERLNENLEDLAGSLVAIRDTVTATLEAAGRQGR